MNLHWVMSRETGATDLSGSYSTNRRPTGSTNRPPEPPRLEEPEIRYRNAQESASEIHH